MTNKPGNVGGGRDTWGGAFEYRFADLPAFDATPQEIDTSLQSTQALVNTSVDSLIVSSDTAANAITEMVAKRALILRAGTYIPVPVAGSNKKLYVRRLSGALVADGLTWSLVEDR